MRSHFMVLVCLMLVIFVAAACVEGVGSSPLTTSRTPWGARTWGGWQEDLAQSLAVDSAGNIYVTGYFMLTVDFDPGSGTDNRTSNGSRDVFLCKFSPQGNLLWTRTWGGTGMDTGNGIAVMPSGAVYVAGRFQETADFDPGNGTDLHTAPNHVNDCFLSKFDTNGNFQWARTWGGTTGDEAYGVAVDAAGTAYVVGDFSSPTVDFDPGAGEDIHINNGLFDAFLTKFDANGNWLWAKTWGGDVYDDGPRVLLDGRGYLYISGMFSSTNADFDPGPGTDFHATNGSIDVFLTKFDTSGNFIWAKTWGGTGDDCGEGLALDDAGNAYVAGYFADMVDFDPNSGVAYATSSGSLDAYLSKLTADGNLQWFKTWGGTGDDRGECVVIDATGRLWVTGIFSDAFDFDPGDGVDIHTSNGLKDCFLSRFATDGAFSWARTWGGSGDELSIGVAGDLAGNMYTVGGFSTTVDFAPGSGGDIHNSNGAKDAFLMVTPGVNGAPTALALAITPRAPQPVNTSLTLTATATGSGSYEYMFRAGYKSGATWYWSTIRGYTTSRTCTWRPAQACTYSVTAYVRQRGFPGSYQLYRTMSYKVTPTPPNAVTLTATPPSPRPVNTTITLTANATGGGPAEYQFRVGYCDATGWHWTVLRSYAAANTCPWIPAVARVYTLQVFARELGGTVSYRANKTLNYVVTNN